jgi:hypothetical protein
MPRPKRHKRFTANQTRALITLALLGWHMIFPAGVDTFSFIYPAKLTAMLLILLPLYTLRMYWAYVGGLLMVLAMFVAAVKALLDGTLGLSFSWYSLLTLLAYLVALDCAFLERPVASLPRTLLGVAGTGTVAIVITALLATNQDAIQSAKWQLTLNRTDRLLMRRDTLDEKIQFLVDQGDLASVAAGIVVDDELVWAEAYGDAELDTVYGIGSLTKPFVATGILQLYEQGLLDLDDDASDYLPSALRHPAYPFEPVTLPMRLTHQFGLAHFTDRYSGYHMSPATAGWISAHQDWDLPRPNPLPTFSDFMAGYLLSGGPYYTKAAWLPARPGSEYNYSTPGYDILAYIVESVTGEPFPAMCPTTSLAR